jgi:serine/threonine protein kinase
MIGQHLREGDLLARRYVLSERIGAGGMSVIWRAWDEALQRTVAVKVLDGPLGTDDGHRDRIRREARAAARIEHPHAIQVYDYGETVTPRGRIAAYVVMQLLDGTSLADRLAAGPLDWPEAVAVAGTVAEVLAAAHRRGVVHRDVTPENVMLTTDGVKLLDFGIAAEFGQREETLTFGTPPYVAPERLAGGQATGATDVYALGVLLFESLTGTTPFGATTWAELEIVSRLVAPQVDVPGLPPAVAAICRRCLSTDPAERPRAEEIAVALAKASAPARRLRRWLLPVAALLAIIAAVALVLTTRDQGAVGPPSGAQSPSSPPTPGASTASTVAPSSALPSPTRPPPSSPAAPTSAPAAPLSPEAAANTVFAVLERRVSSGDLRADVANDVRNQVNDLVAHPLNPQSRIDNLRRKLKDRQREQGLTQEAFVELDAAIVALGNALSSS